MDFLLTHMVGFLIFAKGHTFTAFVAEAAPPAARLSAAYMESYIFEELTLFHSCSIFQRKKSFEREWKMATIWQLSPKVSASMVFHAK